MEETNAEREVKKQSLRKIFIVLPSHDGKMNVQTALALTAGILQPMDKKTMFNFHAVLGCPYITKARNDAVRVFLESDAEELVFIDCDVEFPAWALADLLSHDVDMVAGVYPKKTLPVEWPAMLKLREDSTCIFSDEANNQGLLEATGLPTGFMRIRRSVFEKMAEHYPDLAYIDPLSQKKTYDFFGETLVNGKKEWDDYSFCSRWADMGGRMWIAPNIDFKHIGFHEYNGNFWEYLQKMQKEAAFDNGTKADLVTNN